MADARRERVRSSIDSQGFEIRSDYSGLVRISSCVRKKSTKPNCLIEKQRYFLIDLQHFYVQLARIEARSVPKTLQFNMIRTVAFSRTKNISFGFGFTINRAGKSPWTLSMDSQGAYDALVTAFSSVLSRVTKQPAFVLETKQIIQVPTAMLGMPPTPLPNGRKEIPQKQQRTQSSLQPQKTSLHSSEKNSSEDLITQEQLQAHSSTTTTKTTQEGGARYIARRRSTLDKRQLMLLASINGTLTINNSQVSQQNQKEYQQSQQQQEPQQQSQPQQQQQHQQMNIRIPRPPPIVIPVDPTGDMITTSSSSSINIAQVYASTQSISSCAPSRSGNIVILQKRSRSRRPSRNLTPSSSSMLSGINTSIPSSPSTIPTASSGQQQQQQKGSAILMTPTAPQGDIGQQVGVLNRNRFQQPESMTPSGAGTPNSATSMRVHSRKFKRSSEQSIIAKMNFYTDDALNLNHKENLPTESQTQTQQTWQTESNECDYDLDDGGESAMNDRVEEITFVKANNNNNNNQGIVKQDPSMKYSKDRYNRNGSNAGQKHLLERQRDSSFQLQQESSTTTMENYQNQKFTLSTSSRQLYPTIEQDTIVGGCSQEMSLIQNDSSAVIQTEGSTMLPTRTLATVASTTDTRFPPPRANGERSHINSNVLKERNMNQIQIVKTIQQNGSAILKKARQNSLKSNSQNAVSRTVVMKAVIGSGNGIGVAIPARAASNQKENVDCSNQQNENFLENPVAVAAAAVGGGFMKKKHPLSAAKNLLASPNNRTGKTNSSVVKLSRQNSSGEPTNLKCGNDIQCKLSHSNLKSNYIVKQEEKQQQELSEQKKKESEQNQITQQQHLLILTEKQQEISQSEQRSTRKTQFDNHQEQQARMSEQNQRINPEEKQNELQPETHESTQQNQQQYKQPDGINNTINQKQQTQVQKQREITQEPQKETRKSINPTTINSEIVSQKSHSLSEQPNPKENSKCSNEKKQYHSFDDSEDESNNEQLKPSEFIEKQVKQISQPKSIEIQSNSEETDITIKNLFAKQNKNSNINSDNQFERSLNENVNQPIIVQSTSSNVTNNTAPTRHRSLPRQAQVQVSCDDWSNVKELPIQEIQYVPSVSLNRKVNESNNSKDGEKHQLIQSNEINSNNNQNSTAAQQTEQRAPISIETNWNDSFGIVSAISATVKLGQSTRVSSLSRRDTTIRDVFQDEYWNPVKQPRNYRVESKLQKMDRETARRMSQTTSSMGQSGCSLTFHPSGNGTGIEAVTESVANANEDRTGRGPSPSESKTTSWISESTNPILNRRDAERSFLELAAIGRCVKESKSELESNSQQQKSQNWYGGNEGQTRTSVLDEVKDDWWKSESGSRAEKKEVNSIGVVVPNYWGEKSDLETGQALLDTTQFIGNGNILISQNKGNAAGFEDWDDEFDFL